MAFSVAATIAPLTIDFGCGAFVDTLPYGSALFEESLALIENVEDQQKMVFKNTLVRHPKDPLPPWRDSPKLLRQYGNIILSLIHTTCEPKMVPTCGD